MKLALSVGSTPASYVALVYTEEWLCPHFAAQDCFLYGVRSVWYPQSTGRLRPTDKLGPGKGPEAVTTLSQCPQSIKQSWAQEAHVKVKNGLPAGGWYPKSTAGKCGDGFTGKSVCCTRM